MKLRKVNGHATFEMVLKEEVPHEEKYGNDKADKAADFGAMNEDGRLNCTAISKGCTVA